MKKIITFLFVLLLVFQVLNFAKADSSIPNNVFQESINKNFKPIDKRIEVYLNNLNSSKNYCFGPEKQMNFTECVDYIEKIFSINSDEFVMGEQGYAKACEKSLAETIDKQKYKYISTKDAETILNKSGNNKTCHELYLFKLDIYKSVAYDILKKNKYSILKDTHKKYTQKNRNKYDHLLDIMRVNIGYIERLWKKWPSKTKK